jgi:hypothetical protein
MDVMKQAISAAQLKAVSDVKYTTIHDVPSARKAGIDYEPLMVRRALASP